MAHIVVLTHRYDKFLRGFYMIRGLMEHWARWGHRVGIIVGIHDGIEADLAVVHVDCSVVPPDYLAFAARFPVAINGAQRDNRKRAISRFVVERGDGWNGPVIVKTDLNFRGIPEWRHNEVAAETKEPPPHVSSLTTTSYRLYDSVDAVPELVWSHPELVVERFLPERDENGYWLRTWLFFGDRERCNRNCSPHPIVKGADVFLREPAPVPDVLRAERERLGFDYGKFDFVVHEGRVILLDANRTPGTAPNLAAEFARGAGDLAQGIDLYLKRPHAARS